MSPVRITLLIVTISVHLVTAAPGGKPDQDQTSSSFISSDLNDREMRALHRAQSKNKFALKAEEPGRNKVPAKSSGECRMGDQVHEMGDSWHPDLGEPYGTMFCIHCTCEAVQKKRKLVGRVRCKNLKNECPKLDCKDAVSVPGQCCKECASSVNSTDSESEHKDSSGGDDDDSGNNREYAALLTPRTSQLIVSANGLGEPMMAGLASGRFIFLQKSLHYSFVFNDQMPRAKFIQFVDSEGNVVEEQPVTMNRYQEETRKICGVWRKIPRVYRKLLKEEKLFAALVTEKIDGDNDRYLAGRVSKQKYVSSEMYSSLLEASVQHEAGGMALVTVSPSTGSIYTNIIFNGDFEQTRDIGISVRIQDASGSEAIEEHVSIPKSAFDTNSIEIRSILDMDLLESLSKGRLFIVVYSPKNPDFKLIGFIQARATCDMFDAIIETSSETPTPAGLAWVYPLPDGSWSYNIQLDNEELLEPSSIKVFLGSEELDVLPYTPPSSGISRQVAPLMGPRLYQLLYEENIQISIITSSGPLNGRLQYRNFGDAQLSDVPIVLESGEGSDVQGLLWISVDPHCALNYQLTLLNAPSSTPLRLELTETLELSLMGLPVKSYVLEDSLATSKHDGLFNDFPKMTFVHMKAGDTMFKVVRSSDSSIVASAILHDVRIPTSCLPVRSNPENALDDDYSQDDVGVQLLSSGKCFTDGILREEYSQWSPFNDTCSICTCYKGVVKCEAVVCPVLKCANSVLLTGECCRSCLTPEAPRGKGCSVEGDRFHPAGSSWHPYMSPDGYMLCTTCTCSPDTLTVQCTRQQCPALDCAPEEAVYPKALSCCKVCPPKKTIDPDMMSDAVVQFAAQKTTPSERATLAAGGCKFRGELHENGAEWNHRTEPFGYIPCVTCTCNKGETKCGRQRCPQLSCDFKIQLPGQCCPVCGKTGKSSSRSQSQKVRRPGAKASTKG